MANGHLIKVSSGHLKKTTAGHLSNTAAVPGNISFRLSWFWPGGYTASDNEAEYDLGLYVMQPDGWWLGNWVNGWISTTYAAVPSIFPHNGDGRAGGSGALFWTAYPPFYTYPGTAPGHACPEKVYFPSKPAPEGYYKFYVREWDAGQGLSSYFIGIYRDENIIWSQNRSLNSYPHYSPLFGFNSVTNLVNVIEAA
jgi:hypothetical protein